MKVICDRNALMDAVSVVSGVVVSRTPQPVLKCLKLNAVDGVLTISATDLEVGLLLGVDQVSVESDGQALVPSDKFSQIVRACDDPTLTIETDNHTIHIYGAGSHFTVFGVDPKEFPEVRDFSGVEPDCEIDAGRLHALVSRTLFAAAAEHSRYAINGVLFEREGKKIRMVATDGRRLAVAKGECSKGTGEKKCIIPTKGLRLLTKLIDDPEALVRIAVEDNQAIFSVGDGADAAVLTTNLVEGAFPPFEDVIPRDQDKKATFDAGSLHNAVRRAALLTNEESKGVRLSFSDKKLTLTSRAPEMGEAEIELDMPAYQGEPVDIGFNPSFITDALNVIDTKDVIIELKAPNKPGLIRTGNDFTYVLMPVNLS